MELYKQIVGFEETTNIELEPNNEDLINWDEGEMEDVEIIRKFVIILLLNILKCYS